MKVCVEYTAQMRMIAGASREHIELPEESTLATLIGQLAARWGSEGGAHLLAQNGQPLRSLLIVVNDVVVSPAAALRTNLASGDIVTLLPPIAGG
jgi:molybdopterin converting factor small subunit